MDTALSVVHTLAAMVWVGGSVVLVFVGIPVLRTLEGPERAAAIRRLGRRWRPIGWGALGVAIATGVGNALEADFHGSFRPVFTAKVVLVGALVVTAGFHDFVLAPALGRQLREGRQPTLRRRLIVVGWFSFAFTIAVPVLGVVLVHLD